MKFQKSPFPYVFILSIILSTALYSNFTLDKEINQTIVHSISKQEIKQPEFTQPMFSPIQEELIASLNQ